MGRRSTPRAAQATQPWAYAASSRAKAARWCNRSLLRRGLERSPASPRSTHVDARLASPPRRLTFAWLRHADAAGGGPAATIDLMSYVDAAVAPQRKNGPIKLHGPPAFEGMRQA